MAQYGKPEYWEERYTRDTEPFDWYQRWSGIKDIITQYVLPTHQILHLGCGNSRLSEEMYDDGYINSINIDISQVVIKAMQDKYRDKQTMRFLHMDTRNLEFDEATFDAVIDKGTLDSLLCGENSTAHANKMISEVYRVLSPTGVYVVVSYGQPPNRLIFLDKPDLYNWDVEVKTVAKPTIASTAPLATDDKDMPNVHYIYLCKKRGGREAPRQES